MRSLTYLLYCGTKNRFKEVLKSPAKLIAYLLGIGVLLFFLLSSLNMEMPDFTAPDAEPNYLLLKGMFFAFFAMTFFTTAFSGLKGNSEYKMEDVNFLFVSPIRARTILLYGIIRSLKTILIGSWFIVFQASWLRSGYGIGLDGVFLLWLAYVLFSLACQMLSIFLYAMTNGNLRRIFWVKILLVAAFVPAVAVFAYHTLAADMDIWAGLTALFDSAVADFTPLVGWAATGTMALITGQFAAAGLFLGLVTLFFVALFMIVFIKDPDFYEHVAGATQTAFEATRAAEAGDMQSVMVGVSNKNARVKGTGISRGEGGSVFLFKHLRESFRARKLGLWGLPTLFYILGAGVIAFISRGGYYPTNYDSVVISILSTMYFIGFFTSGMGRGTLELYSHYIYMIPERPFKKFLWANSELIVKFTVEGILIFAVAALVLWGAPLNFALAAIVYITLTFYSLGTSLAFLRITGIASRSVLLSLLMLILYVVPLVPGVALAVFVGILVGGSFGISLALIIIAAWQVTVGLACFAVSQSMLHDCDMLSADGLSAMQ